MNDLISKIGLDKFCHLGIGSLITSFIAIIAMIQELPLDNSWNSLVFPIMGMIVTLILELIKEYIIDESPDKMDIVWTMAGSVIIFIAFLIGTIFNILSC